MENKQKFYSIAIVSIALVLFLILMSSAVSAASVQNFLSKGPYAHTSNAESNTTSVIIKSPYTTASPINDKIEIRGPVFDGSDIIDILNENGGTVTMDASKFAAFYYDLDNHVTTESLSIKNAQDTKDRVIGKNSLVYSTTIGHADYQYEGWGTYPVLGFFADKYIPLKSNDASKLAKLVVDSDDKYTLKTGEKVDLGQGYALEAKQVDVDGKNVWLEFTKDGEFVDDQIVSTDTGDHTWTCLVDKIQGEDDVPVLKVHVNQVFKDAADRFVQIDGLWLIDYANAIKINSDDEFGKLNNVAISGTVLTVSNDDTMTLTRDSDVEIGQGMYFKVADSDDLRFYAYKQITEPGTYEVRGQVASGDASWTAFNFAGFLYDLKKNVQTESLSVSGISGNVIPKNGLVYTTKIVNVDYQYEGWGTYPVLGFFAEQYVPLKPIDASKLAKLVVDSDDKYTLKTGEKVDLGQGYALEARQVDVDGKKVWLEFTKDGEFVDDQIVSTDTGDHTWTCLVDKIQGEDDVPVLKVYVNQVFQGAVDRFVQIDGLWLIDYANAMNIESDDEFGKLNNVAINGPTLTISNDDTMTLTRDSDAEIGQGMYFKVADSDDLRYFPYVEEVIGENSGLIPVADLQNSVYAYITNYNSNTVSVIDTATNTAKATVNVGNEPIGVAISPEGKKVYVTNSNSNSVSVIDTATNTVTTTVNVGNAPVGVAVTPDGKKVYVANSDDNTITVIDTSTNTVIATVPVGDYPSGVAVTSDGKKVYVASSAYIENSTYSSTVYVIDTATNTVTATVDVGAGSIGVGITPDGRKVYIVNGVDNTVSVINAATNTVIATIPVGIHPFGVAVNPDGRKVYVANSDDNTTSVIDTSSNTVTATVRVGTYPLGVVVSQDGRKVYAANGVDNTVSVIDAATNTVIATVNVGLFPFAFGQFIAPPLLSIPNFSTNVTSGYVPLSVQFTDLSQYAVSRNWNFGDGTTSTEQNPSHTYYAAGTYTVSLTTINENGTSPTTKTTTITVTQQSSSSGGSSSGSSSGDSGGGGAGGSPEPAKNVQVKELSQAFVTNGKPVKFDFPKNATCVVYVSFDSKKTAGKTTSIAEQLKNKSTLVSDLNAGEVYKYFNVWVGTGGFATSKNIENPVVCFKVDKSWLQDKKIDKATVMLSRYSDKKWSQLPVKFLNEDSKYLYFTAETPEFSFFAITGKAGEKEKLTETKSATDTSKLEQNSTTMPKTEQEQNSEQENGKGKATSIPGSGMVCGIVCLITVFLYKRK